MRSPEEFLSSLSRRGVSLWTTDRQLHYKAPPGTLSADDMQQLRACKADIIALLEDLTGSLPLGPRPSGSVIPFTAMQKYFWQAYCQRGGLSRRICMLAERISGSLDETLLRDSIAAVVARHESLRIRVVRAGAEPLQEVDAKCTMPFARIDLSGNSQLGEERVRSLAQEFADEDIVPDSDSLSEARLFKLSGHDSILLIAMDHLIVDGVGKRNLSGEIWSTYSRGCQGLPLPSRPAVLQFPDYAVWQGKMYAGLRRKADAYWQRCLAAAPRVEIPCGCDTSQTTQRPGALTDLPFGEELSSRLRELARRQRVTLSLVFLTIYLAVMSRWCRQRDLVVKLPMYGRDHPLLRDMIGCLVNVPLIRIELTDSDSLADLLDRAKAAFRAASEHQEVGIDYVSAYPTDLLFNWRPSDPIAQTLVRAADGAKDLRITPFQFRPSLVTKFSPLFTDTGRDVLVTVLYRPDMLTLGAVEQFHRNLQVCAAAFTCNPGTRIESLSMSFDGSSGPRQSFSQLHAQQDPTQHCLHEN